MGNRRKVPLRKSSTGWWSGERNKVSAYASQGYAYEVRLPHYDRIRYWPGAEPYDALIAQMRQGCHCRVVGHRVAKLDFGTASVRIYLRSAADLMFLRLLTEDVFRVYKLTLSK